ncbi:replication-relaxation family protein [Vagococcus acidifermentans]|uniref:Replication-relaxation n=1 Tax=Vagococcus acidifermentans TaxID=564710 RepID=A0A430AL60_9ENTE|nr:replication-relaxation family protein [Vagococcus acidifermentans]RSU08862.1 hypothetical protein CBF27_13945 [Vagococcus acidifermentans]
MMKYSGLSEKRREILQTIDKYGILTREQILQRVQIAYKDMVYAVKALEELGYIATYQLGRGYVHYITRAGSEYVGSINFGYVKSGQKTPNLATIEHDLLVNDCLLEDIAYIHNQLGDIPVKIVTERDQLAEIALTLDLRQSTASKKRARNRVPDYLLLFENEGNKIINAYEVELSRKNKASLKAKLLWYKDELQRKTYTNVWYVCQQESVKRHVETTAKQVGLPVFFRELSARQP